MQSMTLLVDSTLSLAPWAGQRDAHTVQLRPDRQPRIPRVAPRNWHPSSESHYRRHGACQGISHAKNVTATRLHGPMSTAEPVTGLQEAADTRLRRESAAISSAPEAPGLGPRPQSRQPCAGGLGLPASATLTSLLTAGASALPLHRRQTLFQLLKEVPSQGGRKPCADKPWASLWASPPSPR